MTLVVDDARLMRLAVQPPRDAAEVLRRTSAFRPVVLLCCVLPPLWFAAWSTLEGGSAPWALRALAVQNAKHLEEWLEPGSQWPESDLLTAPPLVSWLTASVLGWFPPGSSLAPVLISCFSLIGAIALLWQLCREAVGERTALIVTVLFALHPRFAPLAATGAPTALTVFLLIATSWGFWGHLEQNQGTVSLRLLVGGIAWGLAMLAGGWLALALFAVLLLASLVSRTAINGTLPSVGERSSLKAVLLLGATGAALALWWPAMMFQAQGFPFLLSWFGFNPDGTEFSGVWHARHRWTEWFGEPGLLLGWWCLGVWSAARISLGREGGRLQRWSRWLLIWNSVGLVGRISWWVMDATPEVLRDWEVFYCLPATLLAAQGMDRALRRETTRLGLAAAIAATVTVLGWQMTHRVGAALIMGVAIFAVLLASAPLAVGLRRARSTWSEGEIRAWVLIAAIATIIGHGASAIIPLTQQEFDHAQWESVRRQIRKVRDVAQTSIIANDRSDLVPWVYLVRSLWPNARFSLGNAGYLEIKSTMMTEANAPQSRIVLLDWSRSGLRVNADVGSGWQVDSVVEPMAFRGRRLAVYLIHPAPPPPPL